MNGMENMSARAAYALEDKIRKEEFLIQRREERRRIKQNQRKRKGMMKQKQNKLLLAQKKTEEECVPEVLATEIPVDPPIQNEVREVSDKLTALKQKKKKRKLEEQETTVKKPVAKKTKKKPKSAPKKCKNVKLDLETNQKNGEEDEWEDMNETTEVQLNTENDVELQNGVMEELVDGEEVEAVKGKDIGAFSVQNSRQQGRKTFQWMISPHTEKEFFSTYWEKKPLYIPRNTEHNYFDGIFSTDSLDEILTKHRILYTKNLDITSYSNGKRETHNPVGQAHPPVVWDYYNNGCSVRMLNPQTFHRPVWKILYNLQEYFNCFCGANVYLTPPDTQGFAPHWDDIEAFILQLEGKKHWKIYKPRTDDEELPVDSSKNLTQEELGKPVLKVTLQPGDLLYFPRGYIHQGQSIDGYHSLHITVSTYQRNTWGHYLEKLLPAALSTAMSEDVEFRRGLPKNYLDVMGIVNMDVETPGRKQFIKKVKKLVTRLLQHAPLDAMADQRGASFMHDALPPLLTPVDNKCCARMGGEHWCPKKNRVENRVELDPTTAVRLIRGNCLRVVAEGDSVNLYHCLENTREYHEEEPQFLEVAMEQAPAVEALVRAYPNYIAIENLPLIEETEKMILASGLWERGLLVTAQPLLPAYDD